jgi:hypothetical protein
MHDLSDTSPIPCESLIAGIQVARGGTGSLLFIHPISGHLLMIRHMAASLNTTMQALQSIHNCFVC